MLLCGCDECTYDFNYSSDRVFCCPIQATRVGLLCKGSSRLPSSSVQYNTLRLWWWRNHPVKQYQGHHRFFSDHLMTSHTALLLLMFKPFYPWTMAMSNENSMGQNQRTLRCVMELPVLLCPCWMNTSFQSEQTFLEMFLMQKTMKQNKYRRFCTADTSIYPVFSCFKQESVLFMEQASSITRTLSMVVSSFNKEQEQPEARKMLLETLRPLNISKHDKVTCDSGLSLLSNQKFFSTLFLLRLIVQKHSFLMFICMFVAIFNILPSI